MPEEIAHEVNMREMAPGETLESKGIFPDDIIETEDATYEREDLHQRQPLLRVWYMRETTVPVPDCSHCGSEKVHHDKKERYVCPFCYGEE